MKKIAIIAGSCPPFAQGGVAMSHYALWKVLNQHGYDCTFFTYNDTCARQNESKIIRSGFSQLGVRFLSVLLKVLFKLSRVGRASELSGILPMAIGCLKMWRKVIAFSPDLIVVPDRSFPHFFLLKSPAPILQIEHHNPSRFSSLLLEGLRTNTADIKLSVRLGQIALKKVSRVVCPSQYMLQEFRKTYSFPHQISVIPNLFLYHDGIAKGISEGGGKINPAGNEEVIFLPSAGNTVKGARYVLAIVQNLITEKPNLKFIISGGYDKILEEEIVTANLEHSVTFLGSISYDKNLAHLQRCILTISPCLLESFSMAQLESIRLGVPVVAFDVGGNREVVSKDAGVLVPLLNISLLCSEALRILNDEPLRKALANGAKEHAKQLMNSSQKKYLQLISSMMRPYGKENI